MKNKAEIISIIKSMYMPHIGGFSGHDEILISQARAFVPADRRNAKS